MYSERRFIRGYYSHTYFRHYYLAYVPSLRSLTICFNTISKISAEKIAWTGSPSSASVFLGRIQMITFPGVCVTGHPVPWGRHARWWRFLRQWRSCTSDPCGFGWLATSILVEEKTSSFAGSWKRAYQAEQVTTGYAVWAQHCSRQPETSTTATSLP